MYTVLCISNIEPSLTLEADICLGTQFRPCCSAVDLLYLALPGDSCFVVTDSRIVIVITL